MCNLPQAGRLWPRMHINAAQHRIVNLLITFFFTHQFLLVFMCLMFGPRQLFFQCGPEMPKGWTLGQSQNISNKYIGTIVLTGVARVGAVGQSERSLVPFLVRAHAWAAVPRSQGTMQEVASWCLTLARMFPTLSFSLSLSVKVNKFLLKEHYYTLKRRHTTFGGDILLSG